MRLVDKTASCVENGKGWAATPPNPSLSLRIWVIYPEIYTIDSIACGELKVYKIFPNRRR